MVLMSKEQKLINIFGGGLYNWLNDSKVISKIQAVLKDEEIECLNNPKTKFILIPSDLFVTILDEEMPKDSRIILYAESILTHHPDQITALLLHEFGHILKGHKSPSLKSEIEADEFVADKGFGKSMLSMLNTFKGLKGINVNDINCRISALNKNLAD